MRKYLEAVLGLILLIITSSVIACDDIEVGTPHAVWVALDPAPLMARDKEGCIWLGSQTLDGRNYRRTMEDGRWVCQ